MEILGRGFANHNNVFMVIRSMFLLPLAVLLSQCRAGYAQEKAPLYMFTTSRDINESLGIEAGRIDYIRNGEVAIEVFRSPIDSRAIPIPASVAITPFSFLACLEDMTVNITWKSMDTSVLGNPVLSFPTSFVFPTCPFRVFSLYPCNTTMVQGQQLQILTELRIDAYTSDKVFDPIVLYFYKSCDNRAPPEFVGATEFPTNVSRHLRVTGDGGCYDDTDLPKTSVTTKMSTSHASPGTIVAAVVVPTIILLILLILAILLLIRFRKNRKIYEFTIDGITETYQTASNPLFDRIEPVKQAGPHEKEFSSENITFCRELGEGAFGRVYEGIATNIIAGEDSTVVAVKQLKLNTSADDDAVLVDFFKEVTFMSKLDHPKVVKLLGVCSVTEPYCMIFEYMDLGSLNSYLRTAIGLGPDCEEVLNKETCFLQLSDLLFIVEQITEGMEYLSNQNLVHRDLATRNCLVATGLVVKVSDFGLSRDVNTTDYYRVRGRAVLPIRWMAPESIMYGKFTTATDVWSFGVVMWEVFTYGQQPYVGMTNEEVIKFVTKQGTLEPPSGCPQKVAKIMTQCWSQSPRSRPSFSKLLTTIQQLPSILKDVTYDSPDYASLKLN